METIRPRTKLLFCHCLKEESDTLMDLRNEAIAIWQEGVDAVDSAKLVRNSIRLEGSSVCICGEEFPLAGGSRIEVVGAGKAGAGMTRGLLSALSDLPDGVSLAGWVNVPEDCVEDSGPIHLHGARPAGVNEPTIKAAEGTREILNRVRALTSIDLCVVLISGGGSALLPAPVAQIRLADKVAATQILAEAGVPIEQLNTVRSQLSVVKGGGLAEACRSGHLVTLIISDVIGDPLQYIASGPTIVPVHTAADALQVLLSVDPCRQRFPDSVYSFLDNQEAELPSSAAPKRATASVSNFVIGSNRVAIAAAEAEARRRGFEVINLGSCNSGNASQHGIAILKRLKQLREKQTQKENASRYCVLAGGETTVKLATCNTPRKGGRNQEVVLAAIDAFPNSDDWEGIAMLSCGTDGEDGPTDAAGAVADQSTIEAIERRGLRPCEYLKVNNSYPFLQSIDALVKTGPTQTNVMDLAVGLISNPQAG